MAPFHFSRRPNKSCCDGQINISRRTNRSIRIMAEQFSQFFYEPGEVCLHAVSRISDSRKRFLVGGNVSDNIPFACNTEGQTRHRDLEQNRNTVYRPSIRFGNRDCTGKYRVPSSRRWPANATL